MCQQLLLRIPQPKVFADGMSGPVCIYYFFGLYFFLYFVSVTCSCCAVFRIPPRGYLLYVHMQIYFNYILNADCSVSDFSLSDRGTCYFNV